MSQTITPELVSPRHPARRRQGGGDPSPRRARRAAGPRHRRRGARSPTHGPASRRTRPGFPAASRFRTRRARPSSPPSLAFARLKPGVDFGASDGPADLVFLIAAPEGAAEAHLAVLSKLARSLMQDDFTAGLRAATTADEVVAIVRNAIGEGDAAPAAAAAPPRPLPRPPLPTRSASTGTRHASSPSPRVRPASPTPSWRRTR